MNKGTKIALWSLGGLGVATGLFFGVRAIVRTAKGREVYGCMNNLADNYNPRATLTDGSCVVTRDDNGEILPPNPRIINEYPLRFGDRGELVKQLQISLNNKWSNDWCSMSMCMGGMYKDKLIIDGKFGPNTAEYLHCHYPNTDCVKCPMFGKGGAFPIGAGDYSSCSVSESLYNEIVGASSFDGYNSMTGDYQEHQGYMSADGQNYNNGGCSQRFSGEPSEGEYLNIIY